MAEEKRRVPLQRRDALLGMNGEETRGEEVGIVGFLSTVGCRFSLSVVGISLAFF